MSNKVALITGASSGIGEALAAEFAKNHTDVVLVARSEQKLNDLAEELSAEYNISAYPIAMDLTTENAAFALWNKIKEKEIDIEYLVNNAGIGSLQEFRKTDSAINHMMMQLNMVVLTELCSLFVKEKTANFLTGKIMNVASTAAFQALPYMAVYGATKAYVLNLTEGLAEELKNTNITLTALCPGPTKSNFGEAANVDPKLANSKYFPDAKQVAEYGYQKMMQGKLLAIHGTTNKIGVLGTRFVSRKVASKISGTLFKKGINED